jgi:hypothetical protein
MYSFILTASVKSSSDVGPVTSREYCSPRRSWPPCPSSFQGFLFAVSDGGAEEQLGSFGPLVASNDVTFATVSGNTIGVLPGSYRAESYGWLTMLRFLYHYMVYYQVSSTQSYNKFYCDNDTLITRLKQAAIPLLHFPRNYLRSDMDLEMQIVDRLRLMELTLTYTHIIGYQDDQPATAIPPDQGGLSQYRL